MTARAVVALGANLGDPAATFAQACELMGQKIGPVVARSTWRETPALVHPDDPVREHPPYLNGVVLVDSALDGETILARLHASIAQLRTLAQQIHAHACQAHPALAAEPPAQAMAQLLALPLARVPVNRSAEPMLFAVD